MPGVLLAKRERGWPVQSGFTGLFLLEMARNRVQVAVFVITGACLVKVERDACLFALSAQIQYPVVVTDTGIGAGFTASYDRMDCGVEIGRHIKRT